MKQILYKDLDNASDTTKANIMGRKCSKQDFGFFFWYFYIMLNPTLGIICSGYCLWVFSTFLGILYFLLTTKTCQ